jgi:hypothetical protein
MTKSLVKEKKKTSILDEIISEIKTDDMTQQIREICDRIMEQELPNSKWMEYAPKGPNKFLILEVDGFLKNETGFLTLERETEQDYVGVHWSFNIAKPNRPARKVKVHTIEGNSAKKIMYHFAKLVKFYRGD